MNNLINKQTDDLTYCYKMIWEKDEFGNVLMCNKAPVNYYEDILIFNKNYDEWEPFAKREVRIKKDSKVRIQKDAKPTFTPIIVKEKKENLKSVKNGFDLFWLKYPQKKGKTPCQIKGVLGRERKKACRAPQCIT